MILIDEYDTPIQQALFSGDSQKLENELRKFLVHTVSSHDVASEVFYHGLILGMSAVFNDYQEVTSNREEGLQGSRGI